MPAGGNRPSWGIEAQPPPHDLEAEQSLLGCILRAACENDRQTLEEFVPAFTPEGFYSKQHGLIFTAIASAYAVGYLPDPITVTDGLRVAEKLDEAGGAAYITSLAGSVFSPSTARQHATIVTRDWRARMLAETYGRQRQAILDGERTDLEAHFSVTERMLEAVRGVGIDSPTIEKSSLRNRIQAAPELLATPGQQQAWWALWQQQGFIGPGIATLVSGHAKIAGKSTALSIGVRDLVRVQPGLRVLILSEEPRSIWLQRLVCWGVSTPSLFFRFADGTPWPTLLREVERAEVQLVLVDTLRAFAGIEDESDASKVVEAVQPLILLARRKNLGVIATHHLRKSEAEGGLAHSGSTALVALFDVALELRQESDHALNRRTLRAVSRFDETPRALTIELRGQEIVPLGTPEAVTLNEVTARVVSVLERFVEGMTRDAIREEMDDPKPSPEQLSRALRTLHADDRVERSGKGVKGDPHIWRLKKFNSSTNPS